MTLVKKILYALNCLWIRISNILLVLMAFSGNNCLMLLPNIKSSVLSSLTCKGTNNNCFFLVRKGTNNDCLTLAMSYRCDDMYKNMPKEKQQR